MPNQFLVSLIFVAASSQGFAAINCDKMQVVTEQKSAAFYPREVHQVKGKGRLYFYAAPDSRCLQKNVFVVPGDELVVYAEYEDWYSVMFIGNTGSAQGWVKRTRLKHIGDLGRER